VNSVSGETVTKVLKKSKRGTILLLDIHRTQIKEQNKNLKQQANIIPDLIVEGLYDWQHIAYKGLVQQNSQASSKAHIGIHFYWLLNNQLLNLKYILPHKT
jgi:hypothetical protein